MEAVAPRCTVCKGNDEWRLQMRDCGHTVCAACGLSLLKQSVKLGKARVKCPKRKCTARIHPNDVDALLDEHNRVLLHHITAEDLIWLREENMKNVMTYALGGASRIRRCPNCHEMYGQRPGCNYVRCADSRCQTKFCWTCGKEQTSWQHFGNNEMCRVGWDDIWQGTWLFRCLLTTNPCCLICISPIVWLLFFVSVPL
uniref:Zinc finger C3HC4 RING-type domain-containing protein n=2 Tax=Plectus sambesii TaxID=2011161 RepID=A0A914WWA8_9BILA